MRKRAFTATTVVFSLLCVVCSAQEQSDFSIFNANDFGEHPVGFRSHWKMDMTRSYVTRFDKGETYGKRKSPRPILVNIWYPAQKGSDQERVRYGDIVSSISEPDIETLKSYSAAMVDHATKIVVTETLGKPEKELNENERIILDQFRQASSYSVRNATPSNQIFPIVIYHSGAGSSFDDNAAFCEWLASFGYIVVGSAFPKGNGNTLTVDAGDDSAQDIAFLIDHVATQANGDWRRVAVIGHSAGAQAALHYASSPTHLADTIILLDTTMDYYGPSIVQRTWRRLVERMQRSRDTFDVPMLVAAGSGASYQWIDGLALSNRTLLTVPHLDHNDFISQGVFSHLFKTRLPREGTGQEDQSQEQFSKIASTYRAVNQYVLHYLEAQLKDSNEQLDQQNLDLVTLPQDSQKLHVETMNAGTVAPAPYLMNSGHPPTSRQLMHLAVNSSADETIRLLTRIRELDSDHALFSYNMLFGSALFEIVQNGELDKAKRIYGYLVESNPKVLSAIKFQGDWAVLRKRYSDARLFYETLLVFEPDNPQTREKLESVMTMESK